APSLATRRAAAVAVRRRRGRGTRSRRRGTSGSPCPFRGPHAAAGPPHASLTRLRVVVVGVRDQGQVARALDRGRQLALVLRLGAGHAARHDLAGLGEVLAQGVEILVVDLLDALGGELAELAAAEKL